MVIILSVGIIVVDVANGPSRDTLWSRRHSYRGMLTSLIGMKRCRLILVVIVNVDGRKSKVSFVFSNRDFYHNDDRVVV